MPGLKAFILAGCPYLWVSDWGEEVFLSWYFSQSSQNSHPGPRQATLQSYMKTPSFTIFQLS